jgi:hypothetical protein
MQYAQSKDKENDIVGILRLKVFSGQTGFVTMDLVSY